MAEEKPTEETKPEPAVESAAETSPTPEPVADLSASGADGVAEVTSTDLAACERQRCKQIRALVDLAGVPEKFNVFVDNNFTVEQTQFALREILGKKNQALGSIPDQQQPDKDAALKAEYAEAVKFKVTMGMTEEEYIKHARRASA